jgi:RimJ/RimL family protein N-acetyltransferase
MAFGPWMEIREGEVHLRLGPIRRDDIRKFVAGEAQFGMQSYEVMRYLGGPTVPTEEAEETWWDKASKDDKRLDWGVYVPDGDDAWKVVGQTSLTLRDNRRQAESGFVLFDRDQWRKRVASTAHLGRTLFAFAALDLLAVVSSVAAPNTGSRRALQGIGYVQTGSRYSLGVVDGRPVDSIEYLLANPAEDAWRYFWRRPDTEIPAEFHDARPVTIRALERAEGAVRYL